MFFLIDCDEPPRITELVLRKRSVMPDTDLRLARNYGMSELFFLRLQVDYDERMQKRAVVDNLKAIMPRAE